MKTSWLLCFGALALDVLLGSVAARSSAEKLPARKLPDGPLIVTYAPGCDGRVVQRAKEGVNVIIWFASNLIAAPTSDAQGEEGKAGGFKPEIQMSLNTTCIMDVQAQLRAQQHKDPAFGPTTHLLSIGGWNAPHPDTRFSGDQYWEAWKAKFALSKFVQETGGVHQDEETPAWPYLFDGIDWDLEGNDTPASPYNEFTPAVFQVVADMSAAAKKDGFLVSIVPPESYFDVLNSGFDLSLRHAPNHRQLPKQYTSTQAAAALPPILSEKPRWHPEFLYQGSNAYTYLFFKHGFADIVDIIDVQLYETYSMPAYFTKYVNTTAANRHSPLNETWAYRTVDDRMDVTRYLREWLDQFGASGVSDAATGSGKTGFWVNFANATDTPSATNGSGDVSATVEPRGKNADDQDWFFVDVPMSKLVVGFSWGWTTNFYAPPSALKALWKDLAETNAADAITESRSGPPQTGLLPRGLMYWELFADGSQAVNNTGTPGHGPAVPMNFTEGWNAFLDVRPRGRGGVEQAPWPARGKHAPDDSREDEGDNENFYIVA